MEARRSLKAYMTTRRAKSYSVSVLTNMIYKHTGRWVWHRSASVVSSKGETYSCHSKLVSTVCLWIMDPHSKAPKKNTSHGNEVLPQDTTHFIQRPCCQRGSPCQNPAGNRATRRPPDHGKETKIAVVCSCLLLIGSGQNHLAGHSKRGMNTRQSEEEVGRQHQGMDRPRVRQVPEGSGEQGKMEETGCEIICGALTTLAVEG